MEEEKISDPFDFFFKNRVTKEQKKAKWKKKRSCWLAPAGNDGHFSSRRKDVAPDDMNSEKSSGVTQRVATRGKQN